MSKEIKHTIDHSPEKIGTREDGTEYKYINMPPVVSTLFKFAEDCVNRSSIKDQEEGKDFIIEMLKQGEKLASWMEEVICKNCRDEDDPSIHNCMADEHFCVSNCDERVSTCICECNTEEILQIKLDKHRKEILHIKEESDIERLSICCGAEEHSDAEGFCCACNEATHFEEMPID